MKRHVIFLSLITAFCVSCSKQTDIRGTFVNDNSEELVIDCDYKIISTVVGTQPMMPENGDKIEFSTQDLGQEKITLSFHWNDILSPFAEWNSSDDEIRVGEAIYKRKDFKLCE